MNTLRSNTLRKHSFIHPVNSNYSSDIQKQRLEMAKAAYTTRRIDISVATKLLESDVTPRSGDVVLAKVVKLGHHKRIELEHGRRAPLFVGDEIIVCYGNRYAPDQFEAEVPGDLGSCHLVAAGGVASRCLSRHGNAKAPTVIQPLGLLSYSDGRVVNLADFALPRATGRPPKPFVLAVVGTSMNAGKTTSAAHLIKGMVRSGMRVGAAKITGTGAGGDRWMMKDAGAVEAVDFTDAGFVSTYRTPIKDVEDILERLTAHLQNTGVDAIVLEVADGLFQGETAELMRSQLFRKYVDGIVFAAGDSMGACAGVSWLQERNLPIVAVSGCVTASPLAAREAQTATGLPALGLDELSSADITVSLFERCHDWMVRTSQVS